MRTLITLICLLFAITIQAQDYTFTKVNCILEVTRGGELRESFQLKDITWTDRSGGKMIEVKDGVTSLALNGYQITNYTDDQVDSLMLDLATWRLACLTRVSGDTLFIGNDTILNNQVQIGVAGSDLTTALAVGTDKAFFRMPYAMTVTDVRAGILTAGTTLLTFDINEGGVSTLSTKLTIDATEKTSETAATPVVISDASWADDAIITFDIDTGSDGAGLVFWIIGYKE